jgi:hypothetical protein
MTQFTPVVPGRLWQVSALLPADQAAEIVRTDWRTVATESSGGQESWSRRQVTWSDPTALRYSGYINECLPRINQALGTEFERMSGHFWIDQPGFTCDMHTDGHLATAMQLYWCVPGPDWGTGFYHFKDPKQLLYQFASRPNSGYIMLNHANPDGSQPLQWHAMFNPVPSGTVRVSSYWYFE